MMSYEGEKENSNGVVNLTLPSPEQVNGDFSKLLNSQGKPVIIYDPTTTKLLPDGTYVRDAYPGNIIPTARINPIAAKVAQIYPPPLNPGVGPAHHVNSP